VSFVWSTARKDWSRQRRDPLAFAIWLGLPLAIGLLMMLLSGGKEGPRPQAQVLVADLDGSFLSNFLVGALSQEGTGDFIRAESVTLPDGRARIADGKGTALLVIPEGFSQAVFAEEPTRLELVTNPAQRILPGIVEETLSILTDAVFYLHRLLGDDLRKIAEGPKEGDTVSDERVSEIAVRINRIVNGLRDTLFPPVIDVAFGAPPAPAAAADTTGGAGNGAAEAGAEEATKKSGPENGVAILFLPGLLFMSLLFMSQGVAADLWQEREQHTLRRVLVSPRGARAFLGGKVLAGCGIMAAVSAVALACGFAYLRLAVVRFPVALMWCTFSGGILLVMMMLIQVLASSQRGGNVLTMALVFPLMMLGGSFFPFEAMPSWMAAAGAWTPNGWALLHLKHILSGTENATSLAGAFGGLVLVSAVLFVLAGKRVSSSFGRA
jgi:ABC-type Na+ efflux pump permease subunit